MPSIHKLTLERRADTPRVLRALASRMDMGGMYREATLVLWAADEIEDLVQHEQASLLKPNSAPPAFNQAWDAMPSFPSLPLAPVTPPAAYTPCSLSDMG